MRRLLVPAALVLAAALGATACSEDTPAAPTDDAVLVEGQDVYGRQCQSCHGASGGGGLGSALQGVSDRLTVEEHIDTVANGRSGSNMPAFEGRLTPEQIEAVVRYEREVLDG